MTARSGAGLKAGHLESEEPGRTASTERPGLMRPGLAKSDSAPNSETTMEKEASGFRWRRDSHIELKLPQPLPAAEVSIVGIDAPEALQLAEWCSKLCSVVVFGDLDAGLKRLQRSPSRLMLCELDRYTHSLGEELTRRSIFLAGRRHSSELLASIRWPGMVLQRPFEGDDLCALVARRLGLPMMGERRSPRRSAS